MIWHETMLIKTLLKGKYIFYRPVLLKHQSRVILGRKLKTLWCHRLEMEVVRKMKIGIVMVSTMESRPMTMIGNNFWNKNQRNSVHLVHNWWLKCAFTCLITFKMVYFYVYILNLFISSCGHSGKRRRVSIFVTYYSQLENTALIPM